MNGNDSSVVPHPSWENRTLVAPSSVVWITNETSVPIHSGGPARQRQVTPCPGSSLVTSKSNVIGASGKATFILDPGPLGPSVRSLHHPLTPAAVATAS